MSVVRPPIFLDSIDVKTVTGLESRQIASPFIHFIKIWVKESGPFAVPDWASTAKQKF